MDYDPPDRVSPLTAEGEYVLLEAAAVKLNLRIRLERLQDDDDLPSSRGGLIRLGRDWIVILDKRAPIQERVGVLARALNRIVEERGQEVGYLPPAVRDIIARTKERKSH